MTALWSVTNSPVSRRMSTDLEFLQEVTVFLEEEALFTPRKSFGKSLHYDDTVHNWSTLSPISSLDDDGLLTRGIEFEGDLSNICEGGKPLIKKSKARSGTDRRQKYRQRVKDEREDLQRTVNELSQQLREIIEARRGTKTAVRTDLVLSKTFWRKIATQQREQRRRVEAEHNRLLEIVNSQETYIKNMGIVLQDCPKTITSLDQNSSLASYDRIDDLKWIRLKSSDATLYEVYLREVNESYARVDSVFNECDVDSMPAGTASSTHRHNPDGDVDYVQYVNKFMYPFDFERTCNGMWEVSKLPHRQIDREVYEDLSDAGNTVAFKFRVKKTLADGSTVSVLKRVLSRRFRDNNQVVIIWKIFSEGEGIFSGMDANETIWVRIRPYLGGVMKDACSRQSPVQHVAINTDVLAVKAFRTMMQDMVVEDAGECARLLREFLRDGGLPNIEHEL
ncbi:hypothetical protein F443_13425 [Phytophthora nicotianae P1569]|uniref:M96 mating-specific protein family n=4 Tax=Phytophthora nicotianae TaxID=4792 RepID=V9ETE9_PHYNI|nr:hypothetical protein F443_13425 [Phytophthora nicotianae P1569]ETO70001.1 hypothetical protein F444_13492 [Phytophthora nicotianae P1976]